MSQSMVEKIAQAVLYEGYMLYPYRPSAVKNQMRFNFGVLYPSSYSEIQTGSDNWEMQTECLLQGGPQSILNVKVKFLQLMARSIHEAVDPNAGAPDLKDVILQPVARLEVDDQIFQSWEEAVEREINVPQCTLDQLISEALQCPVDFPAEGKQEPIYNTKHEIAGAILRSTESLSAVVKVTAEQIASDIFKITVRISNATLFEVGGQPVRERVLMHSLISTHTILHVQNGEFVSSLDPPDRLRTLVSNCSNLGTFPVLAGENGARETMLSSPIILYDYPEIAPESAGDLFDGTEIDEILSLRVLTMTDEEKREMRNSDARARQILERTEALPLEQMMKLHGTLREPHALTEKKTG